MEAWYRVNAAIPFVEHIFEDISAQFADLSRKAIKLIEHVPSIICEREVLARDDTVEMFILYNYYIIFLNFLHEPQSRTMHNIRDERGDQALTLCRLMGPGFPAVRTRQKGKEKRYERQ